MNERDEKFLDRIKPILREMYGKNWDYDFDVNDDGIYLRLNVWAEPEQATDCDVCDGSGRWETTFEEAPTDLVDIGPCPNCGNELKETEESGWPCDPCTEAMPVEVWVSSWEVTA